MSEANREVANLTERKKSTYPLYGVKEFLGLWSTLTPIISGLAVQNGLKILQKQLIMTFLQEIITLTGPIRRGI